MGTWRAPGPSWSRPYRLARPPLAPTIPAWPTGTAASAWYCATWGDLAGARTHYERALKIGQATLGPDHPNVAIFRRNLEDVVQQLGSG